MKLPLSWLKEWVDVGADAHTIGTRLTLAGLELEGVSQAAPPFSGVVVAEIVTAARHPEADKLQVCSVAFGEEAPVQIVCGAANARAGLRVALATIGAVLPGELRIKRAKLRGVESFGMLCSAKELGLAETSDGILELPGDAPVGCDLREWLALDDEIIELNVTPNRGDAMSVRGVAREVAAVFGEGRQITGPALQVVPPASDERRAVHLDWPQGAPRFAGRVIRGIDNTRATPLWLRERLRRAGQRSISPVVDVTNYVLLELGQPMHAYDLAKLQGDVRARAAREGESLTLLDGNTIELAADHLVIADDTGAVGLAGIMGGERTAVSAATVDVFLESAWFSPQIIAGRGRRHGLHTDASQRFERGVDPAGQVEAIERATVLLTQIAGGRPGPTQRVERPEFLPARAPVPLRRARLSRLLGQAPADAAVEGHLRALGMIVERNAEGWAATPPGHRFDITIEADLIEEVARLQGLDAIAGAPLHAAQRIAARPSSEPDEARALELLAARGYHEAINFAFVDAALQSRLFPGAQAAALANPIASDLAVMRVSLWPGLLRALRENQRHQQERVRLVEHGTVFLVDGAATREVDMIAGVASGTRMPEQWGSAKATVDFHDVKGDIEALLATTGDSARIEFVAGAGACLHPGRSAGILRGGRRVGSLGELHPELVRALDLTYVPVLFELEFAALATGMPRFQEVSRFPQVRRDLAIVVDESTPFSAIRERVTLAGSSLLRDLLVFDEYRGPGVESGRKSIALGLIFQDNSRTLTDQDADRIVAAIVADLAGALNAKTRE
ncbi:MAG TPA: phenylalanine--tRNA ligase subunit beta [Steroidobacteraceae bacterium]|nr:phenylalanine--tRNA ligase subunit beta [Steroidobacteraceae bacterium]HNS27627.1 phenylalanine--tRNA ligase subunit beta [Steroidobacteraceae bacterium]